MANSPITDAPDDIVDSLSGSFQLDFVVYDASDGFRRRPIDASWLSERTHDAQLIVWAVLADGIGHHKLFAVFLPAASSHTPRKVNKLLACLI